MSMSFNIGGTDRVVRMILGIALAAIAYFVIPPGVYATIAYIIAAIAFVTGLVKFCPAYAIFGISTCKTR